MARYSIHLSLEVYSLGVGSVTWLIPRSDLDKSSTLKNGGRNGNDWRGQCCYIMVKLNMAINRRVEIVCPRCGWHHERTIENGVIKDSGKGGGILEQICPPKSASSDEPRTKKMRKKKLDARDGQVVQSSDDLIREQFLAERWAELYGGGP